MSYDGSHLGFPTAGLSLTLDPMGKMFQNASSLKSLGQLKPNCPGMIIGRSSTKYMFSCRSRHFEFHIGTKNVKFVEDHPMNIHVQFGFNNICSFCSDMKFKMAATAGLSLTLDPMGKMFQNASSLKPLGAVAAILNFISEQKA
jgi:hypothetical protein